MILSIVSIVVNVVAVILHTTGIFSLVSLYSISQQKIQRLYLINTSLVEVSLLIISLSSTILREIKPFQYWYTYIEVLSLPGSISFYIFMIVLTADRLAKVMLSFKYHLYWTPGRAKRFSIACWVMIGVADILALLAVYTRVNVELVLIMKYVFVPLNCLFVLTAFVTYTVIFCQYQKSQKVLDGFNTNRTVCTNVTNIHVMNASIWKKLKHSFFLIPSLLILTFVLTYSIPSFILSFAAMNLDYPYVPIMYTDTVYLMLNTP